jgi:hypothetical protein
MRAIATVPDHLPAPEPEMPDDLAQDWPELAEAELDDWEPADPGPADWEPADAEHADREPADPEPADWEPADPRLPEAAGREGLKAGRWNRARGQGRGFAVGGVADAVPPGPVLAGFASDAWTAGFDRLTDDELIGVMRAARRLASWAAAMELACVADLWRRRTAEEDAGDTGAARHADDEIAAALTLTGRAADRVLDLAIALRRLPLTSRALAAGDIDLPRAMVVADEVTGLGDDHAVAVERAIAGSAPGQTTGQLRAAARRAVLAADPSAARRRKERAQQDARVERWDEHAGTAALAGRDLPPASVLAADQNLTALARQLKAAGVPGTMDTLRAEAFLTLLSGAPAGSLLPGDPVVPSTTHDAADPSGTVNPSPGLGETVDLPPGLRGTVDRSPGPTGTVGPSPGPGTVGPSPGPTRAVGPSPRVIGAVGPSSGPTGTVGPSPGLRGTVNLTMPLATWLGVSDAPGNASGYGPLDASESRDLARALASRAGNRWCLTFTDARGRPVAHGCARAGPAAVRHQGERAYPRSQAGPPDETTADASAGPGGETCGGDPPTHRSEPSDRPPRRSQARSRSRSRSGSTGDRWTFTVTLLPGDACDHAWQTPAYQPSAALRHLVEARHGTCVFPGCRRPAAQCDKDHTMPYDQGGKTCLCNLAPLCRTHHRAKQAPGWQLTQDQPGVMTWRLPSGRTYQTTGDPYPV